MTSKTRSNNRNNTELTDAELDHVYGGGGQSGWVNTAAGAIMAVNAPWTNQGTLQRGCRGRRARASLQPERALRVAHIARLGR